MTKVRNVAHVAVCDSAFIILFNDGSFSSHGLSKELKKRIKTEQII